MTPAPEPRPEKRAPRPRTESRGGRDHGVRPARRLGTSGLPRGLRVIHDDAEVIVVEKPPGLLTSNMPGERRPSVFDALKDLARTRGGRRARVYIVHRLDREASGLLVFAKSEKALHWLKEDLRSRRMHRLYVAVLEGEAHAAEPGGPPASGTIQSYMTEEGEDGLARSIPIGDVALEGRRMRAARPPAPRGAGRAPPLRDEPRLAVTHYRVLGAGQGRTLVQLRLETGRKNQIRVHMKEWGRPIVGDRRYGAATDPLGRMCLHATELGFRHPATGMTVRFQSPSPLAFRRLVGLAWPGDADASPPPVPVADASRKRPPQPAPPTGSWDHVADWYDRLIGEGRSDLYEAVIVPGTLRLLSPAPGRRVLDVACGQGDLCRRLADLGVEAVGVDASPRLIEAAAARTGAPAGGATPPRYVVGDARSLDDPSLELEASSFDAAACVMALMNINPLEPVCRGVARLLKPGGSFTIVVLHPAFRSPGQTSWEWDATGDAGPSGGQGGAHRATAAPRPPRGRANGRARQFRRVDGYLSPGERAIVMNPGAAASGEPEITTVTYHRPIQAYVKALSEAGLMVDALEEWPSVRVSRPGPRAAEENRARREIPMFLGLRGVRVGATPRGA